ncbi:MAG: tryptophan 7-halogenase [Planctomycetaceae bacterium]|nr:tryptophan 7-halogenase [Planctomycetaceae bacterium]
MDEYRPTLRLPKRVVLLGNDVFAWIASSMLLSRFGPLGIRITVCPGGQSAPSRAFTTTPAFGRFLKNLGVDEHDMLRACQGTYCLASQFSDWAHEGRDFWQPIGQFPHRLLGQELFDVWLSERKAGRLLRPLHSYSAHWTASLARKCPQAFGGESAFQDSGEYGYHGDLSGLRDWLRQLAMANGVEAVEGPIDRVFPNGRGGIAQVKLQSGQAVPGDFFVDLRPGESEDTEQRVMTVRQPGVRQVPVFTRCVATESGWVTVTPLADQTEYRLIYPAALTTDEAAQQQLRHVIRSSVASQTDEMAQVQIEGCGRPAGIDWRDNVVTVGAVTDRLETFSGTAMHLHHAAIERLVSLFPNRRVGRATRTEFCQRTQQMLQQNDEFCQVHWRLAAQRPSAWGQWLSERTGDDGLLAVYDQAGLISPRDPQTPPAWQYQSLLAAAGRLPQRPQLSTATLPPAETGRLLRELVKHNEALVADLPLHEEMLDWIHSRPFPESQAG